MEAFYKIGFLYWVFFNVTYDIWGRRYTSNIYSGLVGEGGLYQLIGMGGRRNHRGGGAVMALNIWRRGMEIFISLGSVLPILVHIKKRYYQHIVIKSENTRRYSGITHYTIIFCFIFCLVCQSVNLKPSPPLQITI